MAETVWRDEDLDAATETLAGAETVAFGGVGYAGAVLPVTEAYRLLERALPSRPDAVRAKLDSLLTRGSAAGKAYAATLLTRFDPPAGEAAWRSLRSQDGEFTTFSGCLMAETTLREHAIQQLGQPEPA